MSNETATKQQQEPEQPQEQPRLSLAEVGTQIKGLISRSALAKIEIGELLNEYTAEIIHGGKEQFYKSIDMSSRTAQYYMSIASNKEVQKLKSEDKLEGLNMQEILVLIGARVNVRGVNNDNAPQQTQDYVAKGFGNFDISKRHTLKEYKIEYVALSSKVLELEARLAEHEGKTAKSS